MPGCQSIAHLVHRLAEAVDLAHHDGLVVRRVVGDLADPHLVDPLRQRGQRQRQHVVGPAGVDAVDVQAGTGLLAGLRRSRRRARRGRDPAGSSSSTGPLETTLIPRDTISVRSSIASKMPVVDHRGVHDAVGLEGEERLLVVGRQRPRARGPVPRSSPASLPTLSGLETHTPTSSRSGRASMPAMACRPTVPVDQATTRFTACSRLGPVVGAGDEVGQAEVEVGHLQPAVDLEHLAGDEAAGRAGQVEHRGRDVLDLADRRSGVLDVISFIVALVARDELQRAGHHAADRDRVDPDGRAEVARGQPGVVRQRRLGRAVGEVAATGHPAHHAGDVDDRAAVVLQHLRHRGPGQRVRGGDVEVERLLEVRRVGVEQGVGDRAADVVDHDVEPAELVVRRVGERRRPRRGSSGPPGRPAPAGRASSMSLATCSSWSAVRAESTTSAPASASASALAAPIPRPAPVTTATFPSTLKRSRIMVENVTGSSFRVTGPAREALVGAACVDDADARTLSSVGAGRFTLGVRRTSGLVSARLRDSGRAMTTDDDDDDARQARSASTSTASGTWSRKVAPCPCSDSTLDHAAVALRDLLGDEQPEPETGQVRGLLLALEDLEDATPGVLGDAGPLVTDRDAGEVDGRGRRDDSDAGPGRGELDRVAEQVDHRALEPHRVAVDPAGEVPTEVDVDLEHLHVLRVGEHVRALHDRVDQLGEVDALEVEALGAVEGEAVAQVGDQRRHHDRRAVHLLEVLADERVELLVLEQDFAEAQDHLRRRGQVVCGHRVQPPLRGQFAVHPAELAEELFLALVSRAVPGSGRFPGG